MGTKVIRVCDVTGKELKKPFHLGFETSDGKTLKYEVEQEVAHKFFSTLIERMPPDILKEVVEDFFGKI